MAKDFIVAIEIGSSKITGIAGRKNTDGSISVLAVAKEDPSMCIRKGVVYNLDRTVQCLTSIITKLKTTLKTEIAYAYVGIGGLSVRSVKNTIVKDLPDDTIVSQDMIDELMDTNRSMEYPDQDILDAITQEYKLDMQHQLDPVGVQCSHLEGNFLNILWRSSHYRNLKKCIGNAGIGIADEFIAPLALADIVLTESEKRSGCVLVDMGAQTTTVAVYFKNILRHLAVIPLGSNNITKDIASLQIEEEEAEQIKLKYACAYTDSADIDDTLTYPVNSDEKIESYKLINVVEARLDEIINNVRYQIPDEYDEHLPGGVIITGGGAAMKNMEEAFRRIGRFDKIRTAKTVNQTIISKHPAITAQDGTMNTILGLLAKGNQNCAGDEITADLFAANGQPKPTVLPSTDQQPTDNGSANSNANGNKDASTAHDATDKTPEEKKEEANKQPGMFNKIGKKVSEFLNKMTEDEE